MPAEKRNQFIVFEGIDGSGKTTQAKLFATYLFEESKYNSVILTREPYKSREIRQIIAKDNGAYSRAEKLAKLFIQDRQEHAKIISFLLEEGIYIVSDRYKLSTIAYQSTQGLDIQELIERHDEMPVPDLTFIIDVPVELALERMKQTKEGREQKFEANLEFQRKLRETYSRFPLLLRGEEIIVVDGRLEIDELHQQIIDIYEQFFPS